jgi:nitroimidazol reductase NimA-like FMN-containing flavoprotein (pyridoxamine 5'-phosphate oxidase superfamily)
MARDYTQKPLYEIRRKDRAVEDEAWIKEFLHQAPNGTLATSFEDQPFLNSNIFVYDENRNAIYLHTAREGRTRSNIDHNPKVCFTIFDMGRLLPAPEALEFSVEYSGVVVFGKCIVVDDDTECTESLHLLLDKYAPHLKRGEDYRAVVPEELKRTAVFRIDIDTWTGKRKKVEEDFPGAFWYKE